MTDYPTDDELKKLKEWDFNKMGFLAYRDYLCGVWIHRYGAWRETKRRLYLATGGWSGNEDIIESLTQTFFWTMAWMKSERGGGFLFDMTAINRIEKQRRNKQ